MPPPIVRCAYLPETFPACMESLTIQSRRVRPRRPPLEYAHSRTRRRCLAQLETGLFEQLPVFVLGALHASRNCEHHHVCILAHSNFVVPPHGEFDE